MVFKEPNHMANNYYCLKWIVEKEFIINKAFPLCQANQEQTTNIVFNYKLSCKTILEGIIVQVEISFNHKIETVKEGNTSNG